MITLQTPVTIQEAITSSEVSVDCYVDNPNTKTVDVNLMIGFNANGDAVYRMLQLWKDEDYDAIGQWTASDAEERIIELLNQ